MKRFYITFCLSIFISVQINAQTPEVLSVSPLPQVINAAISEDIFIHFSMAMNPSSVNDSTLRVFGRWSGPASGSILWENGDSTLHFIQDSNFFNGEWIIINLSKEIQSANGIAIENGFSWNYWIKTEAGTLNQTEFDIVEVRYPGENQITCYGAYAGDINNDGYSDLSVVNESSNDVRLFLNDGSGAYDEFTPFELTSGNTPSPNEGADFNNDGIIDLAIANTQNNIVSVLLGDGMDGFLPEEGYLSDTNVRGIGILDSDGDGDDDIVTANRIGNNISLLLNDGTGSFEDPIHFETGGNTESGIAIADANEDGIMDVFVNAFNSEEIIVMLGDGNNGFSFQNQSNVNGNPWMITVGDINGDGHVDLVSANSNGNNVAALLGDGEGNLGVAVEYESPGFPLAIDLGDIDGDGDLDMVSSNYSSVHYYVYENDGLGNFADPIVYDAMSAASCSILHDRDNDGDLDITGIDEIADLIFLFENDSTLSNISENEYSNTFILSNFPNPCSNKTLISLSKRNEEGEIKIYDLEGKNIQVIAVSQDEKTILLNTENYNSGIYLYEFISSGKCLAKQKMIVIK